MTDQSASTSYSPSSDSQHSAPLGRAGNRNSAASLTARYVQRVTAELAEMGYVVLREKSYKRAQERQRIATVRMRDAQDDRDSQRAWLEREVFPYERHLSARVDYLAGLAGRLGGTADDLRSYDCTCGLSQCLVGKPVAPEASS